MKEKATLCKQRGLLKGCNGRILSMAGKNWSGLLVLYIHFSKMKVVFVCRQNISQRSILHEPKFNMPYICIFLYSFAGKCKIAVAYVFGNIKFCMYN